MNQDELEKIDKKARRAAELSELTPITFEELQAVFDKWMIIPDRGIVKFICALYCTNKLKRKPVWAIIIAPSGGGKTEFLNSLLDLEDAYPISMLTPNTFLSGMPGRGDSSLLPKITGKIMIFKDWTTILSMQRDARAEIMSQLREIWDGSMRKPYGNGRVATWEGKVGLIAASTQAVDMNQQMYTHLGERFINYRIVMPDRKEVAMRSLKNDSNQEVMVKELQYAMYAFMKGIDHNKNEVVLSHQIQNELVDLANFCTYARSGVIRDFGFKKEVIFVPAAEMPTRISQQLNTVATGLYMVNGGNFLLEDMSIIYKAALDSIPQTNKMVIMEMARGDKQSTSEIAAALGYPTDPIRMYLENLAMLKVCYRIKGSGGPDRWTMKKEFVEIIRHYEDVEELSEDDIKEREVINTSVDPFDEFVPPDVV